MGIQQPRGYKFVKQQFTAFRQRLSELASVGMDDNTRNPVLNIDAPLELQHIQPKLIRELEQLHPFGVGNPEPTFLGRNVKVLDQRIVRDDHLKLVVRQGHSVPFECMGFRMGTRENLQRLNRSNNRSGVCS